MTETPAHGDYVAALCHTRDGYLARYDSEHLPAADNVEAIRKATEWRVTAAATIDERTWLQVLFDDVTIHSEELGTTRSATPEGSPITKEKPRLPLSRISPD